MVKKAIVIAAVIAAVVLAVFYYNIHTARTAASGSIDAYNELARSYNEKIEKYNAAASSIAAANEELQGVLNEAGSLADQNKKAYEPRTLEKLQKAIKTAEGRLVEAPVQFDPFEMRELQSSLLCPIILSRSKRYRMHRRVMKTVCRSWQMLRLRPMTL